MGKEEEISEEGKRVAVDAIVNGDYDFAAEILVNEVIEKYKRQGYTEEQIMEAYMKKLERRNEDTVR